MNACKFNVDNGSIDVTVVARFKMEILGRCRRAVPAPKETKEEESI